MPRQQAEMIASRTSQFQGLLAAARNATKPNDSVRALLETLDQFTSLQAEPMGFPVSDDTYTTIIFTNATKIFTISPVGANFDVWVQGKRFRFTTPQAVDISLSIAEGIWYFYFDNTGTLQASQVAWDLSQHAPIALIYWDNTALLSSIFADERHGVVMDWRTHQYNHVTSGMRFQSGLGLTGNTSGDGSLDAHAEVDMAAGFLWDEDIHVNVTDGISGSGRFVQDITPIAQLPIFYLLGTTPDWRKIAATNFPVHNAAPGVTPCSYNQFVGPNWALTTMTNGYHVAMWIFGSSDKYEPLFAIMGQRQDVNLIQARANNDLSNLSLPNLPLPEMRPLFRLIFQTDTSYTAPSGIEARLRDIEDYRQVSPVGGAYVPVSHNAIPGRDVYPAHPGYALNLGTRTQVLYVAQSYGSDAGGIYDGTDPEHPFATLAAARTAAVALAPATDSAGVAIVVLDGMEYDEDFAHVDNVWVIAPYATIKGKHTMAFTGAENYYLRARRLINDGENDIIAATGTAGRAFIHAEHIEMGATTSLVLGCINQASTATLDIVAKRIYSTDARAITSTAAGLISVSAQEIEGGAHAYNLAATSVFSLSCPHIVGPVAITAGATVEFHVTQMADGKDDTGGSFTGAVQWNQSLRVTRTLPAGRYRISWYQEMAISDVGVDIASRAQINDTTTIGEVLWRMDRTQAQGGWEEHSGHDIVSLAAGAYNFDLDVYLSNVGQTVYWRRVRLSIERVG
jgi:hypothetical protein